MMVKNFGDVLIDYVTLCLAKTTMEDDIVEGVRRYYSQASNSLKTAESIVATIKKRKEVENVPRIYMGALKDTVCCWILNYYK